MRSKFKQLLWAFTAPVSGTLGWWKLMFLSIKLDSNIWRYSFNQRKVLIVGSGPSLDRVSEEYFCQFDSIVYINHAIKCAGQVKDEYFFSTDVNVVKGISQKDYFQFIRDLGHTKSILAPIFFQQTLWLSKDFSRCFTWIKASRSFYKIHWTSGRFKFPVTSVLWPVQPDLSDMKAWFSQNNQVSYFPVFEKTSALSAILFVAKYEPKSITLIGCDFGKGRAKDIEDDCPGHVMDIFGGAAERFNYIKKFLAKKSIDLQNDSWVSKDRKEK